MPGGQSPQVTQNGTLPQGKVEETAFHGVSLIPVCVFAFGNTFKVRSLDACEKCVLHGDLERG